MSEQPSTILGRNPAEGSTANIIYILYLAGLVVGVTSLIGVVMAYVNRAGAPEWVESHYRFQIRTFWIGLLYGVIGLVASVIVIGWLVLIFAVVWYILRCVKGMKQIADGAPCPNVETWLW